MGMRPTVTDVAWSVCLSVSADHNRELCFTQGEVRAVLTNGHTGHVPRAPGFFSFLRGPQLAVVKLILDDGAINAANFLP